MENNEIKIGNYLLKNYVHTSVIKDESNFWRIYHDKNNGDHLYIGFLLSSYDRPILERYWTIDIFCGRRSIQLRDFLFSYVDTNKKYSFDELEQAKIDLDKFIIRMNKLLIFT